MNTIIDKGYTVVYDTSDGKIGFIGIDDHSGGYPYFASWVDTRNVFQEISKAFHLLKSARGMKTYYGANRVHFGTMRVVRMTHVFEEVDEDEDEIYLKETLKKLDADELAVIKRHLTPGGAK